MKVHHTKRLRRMAILQTLLMLLIKCCLGESVNLSNNDNPPITRPERGGSTVVSRIDTNQEDVSTSRSSSSIEGLILPSWGEQYYQGADNDIQRNRRKLRPVPSTRQKGISALLPKQAAAAPPTTTTVRRIKDTPPPNNQQRKHRVNAKFGAATADTDDNSWRFFYKHGPIQPPPSSFRNTNGAGTTQLLTTSNIQMRPNDISLETIDDDKKDDLLSISICPESTAGFVQVVVWGVLKHFFGKAVGGTLALVLPLYVAQRILYHGLLLPAQDWYTGRYLRLTYESMEKQYNKAYYQVIPAASRSFGRIAFHLTVLVGLGKMMEWMVGLDHAPCLFVRTNGRCGGCHWWCALLWMVAVVGTGHAAGVAVSIWGPLRITVMNHFEEYYNLSNYGKTTNGSVSTMDDTAISSNDRRPSGRRLFRRPLALMHFILDPDQWFREIVAKDRRRKAAAALKPFYPDPLMFPATWGFVRALQFLAVAKEMYVSRDCMHSFMRQVLIEQAFSDEWYRVFTCEKRVGLGIAVMLGYLCSTINLFWIMISKPVPSVSSLSILLMLPSVIAVIVSAWMNVLVYYNRGVTGKHDNRHSQPVVSSTNVASAVSDALSVNLFPKAH